MASVSSSPAHTSNISAEFGSYHRTRTSKRSWRLLSRRKKAQKVFDESYSGERPQWSHISWSTRGRRSSQSHSASEIGSPTRKSIADLLDDIPPPRSNIDWISFTSFTNTQRSRSTSPAKEQSTTTNQPATPSKRRKSISNLFYASLRGHSIRSSISKGHQSIDHKDELQSPKSIAIESAVSDGQLTSGNSPREEQQDNRLSTIFSDTRNSPPAYRLRPIPRVQFATSDVNDDPFEEPPRETIVSSREIQAPVEERRLCSKATVASNAPTLFSESCQRSSHMFHSKNERPKTPDSYLQLLVESYECPSEVSSSSRTQLSPTPSPTKHHAVQPLDFLADKYTPVLHERNSLEFDLAVFQCSPSTRLSQPDKNEGFRRQQSIVHKLSTAEEHTWSDAYNSNKGTIPRYSDEELTWDVGDIDINFQQRLQERNDRYQSLEHEFEALSSSVLDREYIAQSIKLTVAKMTKNYHQARSSDDQISTENSDGGILIRDALQFDKYLGPQITRSYQFGFDNGEIRDFASHNRQINKEAQKKPHPYAASARSPSPILDAAPSFQSDGLRTNSDHSDRKLRTVDFIERAPQGSPAHSPGRNLGLDGSKLRPSFESIGEENKSAASASSHGFEQDRGSAWKKTERSKPNVSDAAKDVANLMSFAEQLAQEVSAHTDDAGMSPELAGSCKQDSRRRGGYNNQTSPAKEIENMPDRKSSKINIELNTPIFRDQADPSWLKEVLGIRSTCPQVSPFSRSIRSRRSVNNLWPPLAAVERTLEDSTELRAHEDNVDQALSRLEPISVSRPVLSGRRRIVSAAAVHVQFPASKNKRTELETFDSRSKAFAALYDYKLRPLSNHVIYDPVKRIFHAQDLDSPDSTVLEESGLELVWLPLQPNSPFQVAAPEICGNRSAKSATRDERRPVISIAQEQNNASVRYLINRSSSDEKFDLAESESSDLDPCVHKEVLEQLRESTEETRAISECKLDWTASDEEYVMEVGSDIARNCLSGEDSESVCSTPKLESGIILYPNLPRISLDDDDDDDDEISHKFDDETSLKETKTWPQLAREFKAKHPELFGPLSRSIIENWSANCDADSESSSDSGLSDSWSIKSDTIATIASTIAKLPKIDYRSRSIQERQHPFGLSQLSAVRTKIWDSSDASQSSNDMPAVKIEHIENIGIDDQKLAKQKKDAGHLTISSDVEEQGDRFGTRSLRDHVLTKTKNQDASSSAETYALIRSWAEAERAQARLFQTDPSDEPHESCLGSDEVFSIRGRSLFGGEDISTRNLRPELTRSRSILVNYPTQDSRTRSLSLASFVAGSPSTAHTEGMRKGHVSLDEKGSLQIDNHSLTSSLREGHDISDLQQTKREGPAYQVKVNKAFVSKIAVPGRSRMVDKSGLLKIVDQVKDLNAVTPEDLNLRLVGNAARQSELAKSSKVSSLIDVFKGRGLMSEPLKPGVNTTTSSPGPKTGAGRRPTVLTRIVTPSGNIYRPSETVESDKTEHSPQIPEPAKRVPTLASTLSDADTELDEGFGEELIRVKRHL